MNKIIISVVSALLILFPFSSFLRGTYQQLSFPGKQEITNDIVDAIKSNDIDVIEDMLSKDTIQNMADPQKDISDFLQVIDGDIIEARNSHGGGGESDSGAGYVYKVETWKIEIKTTQTTYWIWATWVIADTRTPKNVGLVGMTVTDTSYNLLSEIC